ncbi:MAG: Abi-alpha family protein [Limisphaerales bacterium]
MNPNALDPQTAAAVGTAVGTAVAVNEAKGLIGKFLGPACKEVGETLADRVRLFRLERQVRILRKAKEMLEREGLTPKAVSLKTFVPLLEAGALEEDDAMSDRWSALLASAADPRSATDIEPAFVDILKQLSPTQARVLDVIYDQVEKQKIPPTQWHQRGIITQRLQDRLKLEGSVFLLAIDNCLRLRLLAFPSVELDFISDKDARFQLTNSSLLCPTHLGYAFVKACRGDVSCTEASSIPSDTAKTVHHTIDTAPRWL